MNNKEKCQILQNLIDADTVSVGSYYKTLENIGDIKYNYGDYLITEPIDCDMELARLKDADYELCCVLLTLLFREDHFCDGSFEIRYGAGQVKPIVEKMITLLSSGE